MDTPDYQARLQQQVEQYRHVENMHDLPAIYHYWSNKYLRPKIKEVLEVDSITEFYAEHLRRAAGRHKGPYRFASLGAGDCLVEIDVANSLRTGGLENFIFECFELSPVLLARAQASAKAEGLEKHIRLIPTDLNKWTPRPQSYTGVIANHSLHHFVDLETIFDNTHTALRTDGVFITNDMIGRNGHMRWPEALSRVERIWNTLPNRLKFNQQLKTLDETFVNRDCSVEGFEGIRAQDILPLLLTRFHFTHFLAFGGLIDVFIDRGYGHNFDPADEKDLALIDSIAQQNEAALAQGTIKPTMLLAVMTPGQVARPKCHQSLTPEFSVRPPSIIELNAATIPKVSIVIPVLNKVDFTRKCLDALRRHTPAGHYEVVVWDNGSTDGTKDYLEKQCAVDPAVRYYRSEENLGFVGGNNAAVQHARGEFLVFLNNDTEPQAGWLEALLQTVESDSTVGAVGAKLVYPDGKLQEAGGIIFRDASGWNYGRTQDPRDPRFNFPREVDYCSAACLLVRTALFRQLGGFDVRYSPAYYEDTDLCFALRHHGYRVVYQPRCEIIHHEGATAGQDLTKGFKQYQVANRQKFTEKWKEALGRQHAPDASLVRRASHRARGQRILVIDPLLPMYDRASGSRRLFEMLKILAAGGNAVTFIARNGQGGERYVAELQALGIEVYAGDAERMKECGFAVKCWPLDLPKLLRDSQYETIILSFWYVAEQYLSRLRTWSPKSRVVIDTVDVHFLRERRQAELYQDHKLLLRALDTYRRELNVYRQADALITVTEDDRQALLKEIPQSCIFVAPNIHEVAADIPPVDHRNGLLFVGGFGHPPNEDAVLYFHREVWPRILQRVPAARWTIVGNNPPAAVQALAGPAIEVTGYVPSMEPYLRSHLVSVAPLRYGAGMKGKIGEALANGLPVVTTHIGAEGMGLEDGKGGTLVGDDPEAFANHVARLYTDRGLWNQLSAQGRQHIESHFTPQCIARQLETLLDWSSSFCSIVVLALNQWEHTEKCLASLACHTPEPHEVILVDNGSTDKTPEALRVMAVKNQRVRVIFNRENRGFAAGNNQALAIARGDVVVLLNNDTVVTPGWLGRMLEVLKRHPDTGVVGPMSNHVSGPQRVSDVSYTDLAGLPAFAESWAAAHDEQAFEVGRAVGFCLLARREVIERIGGLDERFGSGNFEDDDFCIRARLAGWRIRIAKDSFVHHTGSQTFKGAKIDYRSAMLRNWDLFRTKWQLPADVVLEQGYPLPQRLPAGVPLNAPLSALELTHAITSDRIWSQRPPASARTLSEDELPPAAKLGRLDDARDLFGRRNYADAWQAAVTALQARPFHPEACLLLAEIALAAGDAAAARLCAQRATEFAPRWKAARQFLKQPLKGDAKPEWPALPEQISNPKSETRHRLTVGVLTKNEERFIAQCLNSVKGIADQIIVLDTGSTDRTIEIAKSLGAEVHSTTWNDDFSAPRNLVLEHATGDWILMLDADEELPADQHAALRADLRKPEAIAYRVPLVNRGQEAEGQSFIPRLFRNAPGAHYYGRIHEQVFPSLLPLCKKFGLDTALGTARLLHHGYTKELVRDRNKIERNLNLLRLAIAERPDEPNLMLNLGLELVRSGDLDAGIVHYRDAFRLMSAQKPAEVVPELREVLLTQFTSHLYKVRAHDTVVQVLTSPLAKVGSGLTASMHFALGLSSFELKDYRQAADHMRQCLAKLKQPALSPINTDILTAAPHHCLALALAKLNDVAGAEKAFQAGLAMTSRTEDMQVDYARFLMAQQRPVEALQSLNEVVQRNATHSSAWRLGGEIGLSQPEYLEFARDWTAEAVRQLPNDLAVVAQRAEALMLSRETREARPLWERACNGARPARAVAAAILCATLEAQPGLSPQNAAEEVNVSRAFVDWYRRLVAFNAVETVVQLNSRVGHLRETLPGAARVIETVTAAADAA